MKIHRFIGNFNIKVGEYILLDQNIVHQIWDVLKLRPGEKIIICDGNLTEGFASITGKNGSGVSLNIETVSLNNTEPQNKVILYCSVLKSDNFELICQKATEVGVLEIVPIITERTVKLNLKSDRMLKIIREAAEQSGRGRLPLYREPISLEEAIKEAAEYECKICLDVSGLANNVSGARSALFIGPEGGWSNKELENFKNNNFQIISLGPRILRAETAAIIGTFLATR